MPTKSLWMLALLGFGLTTSAHTQTAEALDPPSKSTAKKKVKKPKTQATSKATFVPGSQETKTERSARLTRECKGEVNAGACTGYTR